MKYVKQERKRLIALAILIVVFVILSVLKNNVAVCEFFATTFARWWIFVFGNIFGWLPFSMYELLLICAIICVLCIVVRTIILFCKKNWQKACSVIITCAIIAMSFVNVYTAVASMSYNRAGLPVPTYQGDASDVTFEQAQLVANAVVDNLNSLYDAVQRDENGNVIMPSFDELNQLIANEYKRLNNGYFSSYTPKAKRIANKRIMSEMGFTGVFFAPTGEANINGNENNFLLPFTMVHELAHAKGVMREADANTVACYLLLTAENPYLRYSAYMWCIHQALQLVSLYPNSNTVYTELLERLDGGVFAEWDNYYEFYEQFTLLEDIGDYFNDIYLKINGQDDGVESYYEPTQVEYTGELDLFDKPICVIVEFSNVQSLLLELYRQGDLQ